MSELERDQIHKAISEEIEEAVKFARESPYPNENDLLHDVFKLK
jgi:TPP-dependent pyruvate/acetoin dehydrogenase alpha subunit